MYLPYHKLCTKPHAFFFFFLCSFPLRIGEKNVSLFQELQWLYNRYVYFFRVLSKENWNSFFFFCINWLFKASPGGERSHWRGPVSKLKNKDDRSRDTSVYISMLWTNVPENTSKPLLMPALDLFSSKWNMEIFSWLSSKIKQLQSTLVWLGTFKLSIFIVALALSKLNYVYRRMRLAMLYIVVTVTCLHDQIF